MIKMKRGEMHPIFNLSYLAENIASLVETTVLFVEYAFVLLFLANFLSNLFENFVHNFVPAVMMNAVSVEIFASFGSQSNTDTNFIALGIAIFVYYMSRKYFEFVKYNLHPNKTRSGSKLLSAPK